MAEGDEEVIWPNRPRSIFAEGPPAFAANTGWLADTPKPYGYLAAYRQAAEAIFERISKDASSREIWLFPLAYAWRHHIELLLKELIPLSSTVLFLRGQDDDVPAQPEGHPILPLWIRLRPLLGRIAGPGAVEVDHVDCLLRELHGIDSTGVAFRYATPSRQPDTTTLKGVPHTINLYVLHEAMTAVSNYLDATRTAFESEIEVRGDALSALGQSE
jgi:hypothetical protein